MAESIFDDKSAKPNDKILKVELGETKEYIDKIILFVKKEYGDLSFEWKFYGQKTGWLLKMFHMKRNILFVVPCKGYFRAAFTFGDKAVDEVIDSELPDIIKHKLLNAKKYSEGRTIQLEITNKDQMEKIFELIKIKLRN